MITEVYAPRHSTCAAAAGLRQRDGRPMKHGANPMERRDPCEAFAPSIHPARELAKSTAAPSFFVLGNR